jgi:hypothetical protein
MADFLQPRVLIIDDVAEGGRALKKLIERVHKYKVCFPATVDSLQETVLYEAFDTVVIDADLSRWTRFRPITIFGEEIRNGIDLARVYCEFQGNTLIVLFGPNTLPAKQQRALARLSGCNIRTIDRPLPSNQDDIKAILDVLKPAIEETESIHEENPIFQRAELFDGMPSEEKSLRRRLQYRQTLEDRGEWLNCGLKRNADSSWTVLCGGDVQKNFYGPPLDKHRRPSPEVKIRTRYPQSTELSKLAATKKTLPFVIWNTRDTSILAKQFDRRSEIPFTLVDDFGKTLVDDFGMRVAEPCAQAYNEEDSKNVIEWCQTLSSFGQLDVLRSVFKSFNGDRERSTAVLAEQCKKADLIHVVDVYNARVEKLLPQENKAVIELHNLTGDEDFSAPFDLSKLTRKGIKEANQCFEYTVAVDQRSNPFGQIELAE